jgi:hypothetical protein
MRVGSARALTPTLSQREREREKSGTLSQREREKSRASAQAGSSVPRASGCMNCPGQSPLPLAGEG